ncbi:outer membrane protein assembly factor BamA [Burkholderiaceae bacterium FT117]|uniref:outer membrane protein assembly factor BamA n=1 Tax=Zeimonas sediminis TaxID=2944268 RepID=UPI002342DEFA|nr:outer membrane protein assembly factor BamA [Zeimonas sediminis]MCM5569192.1 outer membrane protein assembly factor BamA [Zeimonas sediminis]
MLLQRRRPRRGRSAVRLAIASAVALVLARAAFAFDPFVVRDIRIEGVQRTEPGTVFSYLPVKVGDRLTEDGASEAVRALFATGFFRDVRLEVEGDVLVVYVEERPAIASVSIVGAKEFDEETLKRVLRDQGLGESRIFDRSVLERAEQELKRQYLARGRYAASVTSTITPLERNRVGIVLTIDEGEVARIGAIRFVGNKAFTEKQLLEEMRLTTPNWFTWYSKADQYSREKFAGDLEALRSFYLDRGYLEFEVQSTQVSITPDRERVELTISVREGEQFRVSGVSFGGTLLGREAEFAELVALKPGDVFSGARLTESTRRISDRLGQLGYAFANVNAVPSVDREKREVSFEILVDPARRAYVRRINITGNSRTRDEVIRRELRQYEDAWYDANKIRLSRERVSRLGYFTDVRIDTQPVPDAPDQVDLNVVVTEQPTGNVTFGVGFSSTEKVILSASLNQQNFMGTGKSLGLNINTSKLFRTVAVSYSDPYFTPDGVSRSFDLYTRTYNASELDLGDYRIRSSGIGLRFGVPYTEHDRISFGMVAERNEVKLGALAPDRYIQQVADFGESANALLAVAGWSRDTRDSALIPTRGRLQSASVDVTLPVGDLRYWRAIYKQEWYYPLSRDYTIALYGDIGVGDSFGGVPYPLFKNFYAGGIGSVRGYYPSSLGPKDTEQLLSGGTRLVPLGGQSRLVGSAEFIFPLPGTGSDRSIRSFVFLDAGNVFSDTSIDLGELRYSTGVGLNWLSPIGPLKLSIAYPLNKETGDRTQRLQFQIGTGF